ncbi:zinc-ribbon domain-containing protein [Clostridium aminobutyricum]|uniref:Zinc-ribbon domain-containing protein n=1 Tax=Clostridium aminobutyricum TaxID=33953 RepID=A0A939IGS3_CLOAM|nr:zinc-ribbon domain-containing protein [Clostridium aminobutyricum]
MRCIHCGKEVRDGVVFCIHCDRPVKREYAHYACEFYDSVSVRERLFNILTGIFSSGNTQKEFRKYKHHSNRVNNKLNLNQKVHSAKNAYGHYLKSISNINSSSISSKSEESINLEDLVKKGKNLWKYLSQ